MGIDMKKIALVGLLTVSVSTGVMADGHGSDGQQLFIEHCSACHSLTGPATLAPPVFAIAQRTKKDFPNEQEFVVRLMDWVVNPSVDNALMKGAIDKFGVMPKMDFSQVDVEAIAKYIYAGDFEVPAEHAEKHADGDH